YIIMNPIYCATYNFSWSMLVGAPRANTTQRLIVEGGAVYLCTWPTMDCKPLVFDSTGIVDYKSQQWFGASLRSYKSVACAPLYHWRTLKAVEEKDPVGTCYLAYNNFSRIAEYSPCRNRGGDPQGQGFCQGGFSVDLTQVRFFGRPTTHAMLFHKHMASYFGFTVAVADVNDDGLDDVFVGAPLYMERGADGKLREVGRVYQYLQDPIPLNFRTPQTLTGSQTYARFGSALAPLGDLDDDGYNDLAVGVPFGGENHGGLVYIYNGGREGLQPTASQVLKSHWPSGLNALPPSFGYALRGGTDVDGNGYPGENLKLLLDNRIYPSLQAHILLDCGKDNICIPDLHLSVSKDQKNLYVGAENELRLLLKAFNKGEGAYEAEIQVSLPPEADYVGFTRIKRQSTCAYKSLNATRTVVCGLGNPMQSGAEVSTLKTITLTTITATAHDVGIFNVLVPYIFYSSCILQLRNAGPSSVKNARMNISWPVRSGDNFTLYPVEKATEGPIKCSLVAGTINPLGLQDCGNSECVQLTCTIGQLNKAQIAVLQLRSRLWTSTFIQHENQKFSLEGEAQFEVLSFPYRIQPEDYPSGHVKVPPGCQCSISFLFHRERNWRDSLSLALIFMSLLAVSQRSIDV
uniref:Integrin, alpha 8 n=1 Tax=Eptatretus burgeri TaxID=7764 RepID=A0A8C4R940_EPTBU